jgi:ABC-2 type transport system permease protein
LQRPMSPLVRIGAKAIVLLAGWGIAGVASLVAIGLWKSYGGAAYMPEIAVVAFGHVLNAGLTIALAAAASSMAEHPSTAAILTLAFTVGTWIVDFVAAIHGGVWARIAAVTPAAMVGMFQHGLVEVSVVLAALALIGAGLVVAAVWMRIGVAAPRRALESAAVVAAAAAVVFGCTFVRGSWDGSEGRRNSFSEAEEAVLEHITTPLTIEVHLAPVDPRRLELERVALPKLRRVMPALNVRYVSRTSSGLYEQADPGYGEIWYDLGGKRAMSRVTTEEGVLETITELAGVVAGQDTEVEFNGHPLVARPVWAATVFYGAWPIAVGAAAFFALRRHA